MPILCTIMHLQMGSSSNNDSKGLDKRSNLSRISALSTTKRVLYPLCLKPTQKSHSHLKKIILVSFRLCATLTVDVMRKESHFFSTHILPCYARIWLSTYESKVALAYKASRRKWNTVSNSDQLCLVACKDCNLWGPWENECFLHTLDSASDFHVWSWKSCQCLILEQPMILISRTKGVFLNIPIL